MPVIEALPIEIPSFRFGNFIWISSILQEALLNHYQLILQLLFCCCSATKLCLSLCDPIDCIMPGFPVLHNLPEFTQIHVHWVGSGNKFSGPVSFIHHLLHAFLCQIALLSVLHVCGERERASPCSLRAQEWWSAVRENHREQTWVVHRIPQNDLGKRSRL